MTMTRRSKVKITVLTDADRLVMEQPGWNLNFALAMLACRYMKKEYSEMAQEILEDRLNHTKVDHSWPLTRDRGSD